MLWNVQTTSIARCRTSLPHTDSSLPPLCRLKSTTSNKKPGHLKKQQQQKKIGHTCKQTQSRFLSELNHILQARLTICVHVEFTQFFTNTKKDCGIWLEMQFGFNLNLTLDGTSHFKKFFYYLTNQLPHLSSTTELIGGIIKFSWCPTTHTDAGLCITVPREIAIPN